MEHSTERYVHPNFPGYLDAAVYVVCTAALLSELAGKGCADYLEKPFSPDDLVPRIRAILGGDSP